MFKFSDHWKSSFFNIKASAVERATAWWPFTPSLILSFQLLLTFLLQHTLSLPLVHFISKASIHSHIVIQVAFVLHSSRAHSFRRQFFSNLNNSISSCLSFLQSHIVKKSRMGASSEVQTKLTPESTGPSFICNSSKPRVPKNIGSPIKSIRRRSSRSQKVFSGVKPSIDIVKCYICLRNMLQGAIMRCKVCNTSVHRFCFVQHVSDIITNDSKWTCPTCMSKKPEKKNSDTTSAAFIVPNAPHVTPEKSLREEAVKNKSSQANNSQYQSMRSLKKQTVNSKLNSQDTKSSSLTTRKHAATQPRDKKGRFTKHMISERARPKCASLPTENENVKFLSDSRLKIKKTRTPSPKAVDSEQAYAVPFDSNASAENLHKRSGENLSTAGRLNKATRKMESQTLLEKTDSEIKSSLSPQIAQKKNNDALQAKDSNSKFDHSCSHARNAILSNVDPATGSTEFPSASNRNGIDGLNIMNGNNMSVSIIHNHQDELRVMDNSRTNVEGNARRYRKRISSPNEHSIPLEKLNELQHLLTYYPPVKWMLSFVPVLHITQMIRASENS